MRKLIVVIFLINLYSISLFSQAAKSSSVQQFVKRSLTHQLIAPQQIIKKSEGCFFIDFGKDAFGVPVLPVSSILPDSIQLIMGEAKNGSGEVDTNPVGSIRFWKGKAEFLKKDSLYYLKLPAFKAPDWANQTEHVKVPYAIEDIIPFRYCEIKGMPADFDPKTIRQLMVLYPFNDSAAVFHSSDPVLNAVWELCKYSIKATTFCGIYIDGDRERKPYEADAYINQLGHYCLDSEYALARYTQEYFFTHPTWPTEWKSHSILMAWEEYMFTGNTDFLIKYYDSLKNEKLQPESINDGGLLICSKTNQRPNDIIDWPISERDGYEIRDVNLVPNAFYYRSMVLMAKIAYLTGHLQDEVLFQHRAKKLFNTIQECFFDSESGLYRDAVGSNHHSLHANFFPLAFGLVPDKNKQNIIRFIKTKGMACSVYGAQYLLEALYAEGEGDYAYALLTSTGKRSWVNMIRSGATITTEAWDKEFKPNLDWNHSWGSAPVNIIPRGMFGIQPIVPAFGKFRIRPQTGSLQNGGITFPTIKGIIKVEFTNDSKNKQYRLLVNVPVDTEAEIEMPNPYNGKVFVDRKERSDLGNKNSIKIESGLHWLISCDSIDF